MPEWLLVIIGMAAVPVLSWVMLKFIPSQKLYDFAFNIGSVYFASRTPSVVPVQL